MNTEQLLKKFKANRGSIKQRLTIFKKCVQKCENSPSETDFLELNSRLNRYRDLIGDFDSIQTEIDALVSDENSADEFLIREEFENEFHSVFSKAQKILDTHKVQKVVQDDDKVSNGDLEISSHNDLNTNVQNRNCDDPSGVKLPLINLPTFSGEPSDWLQFQDTFEGLIIKNSRLSNVQKFHYLKSSLKGEALETVANFQLTNDNFTIAWETLSDQYTDRRALLHEHTKALYSIDAIKVESSKGLKHIVDHIKMHLRSLQALGEPVEYWDTLLIYFITSKLDSVTMREWESKPFPDTPPSLEELLQFLMQKSKILKKIEEKQGETSKHLKTTPNTSSSYKGKFSNQRSFQSSFRPCVACKSTNHRIFNCGKFLKMSVSERMNFTKNANLCTNCLNSNHQVDQCRLSTCKTCSAKHHTLLHASAQNPTAQIQNSTNTASVTVANLSSSSEQILLSTVLLEVIDSGGNSHECRALLDSGSQSNFLSAKFCRQLGLKTQGVNIAVSGITKVESNIRLQCKIKIVSRHNSFSTNLTCLVVPEICDNLPDRVVDKSSLGIPPNIQLADPEFYCPKPIDLLIGADLFWSSLCIGQIKLGMNLPTLHKTKFGWILAGPVTCSTLQNNIPTLCHFSKNIDIQEQLSRFWEIEECSTARAYSQEELACEGDFVTTHRRNSDGRFIVSLPLKEPLSKLGDSREQALKRFYSLERKLQRNTSLKDRYVKFMAEYESLGHMSKVIESTSHIQFFFPHHGVLKEESLSTKLRVVFDGSCPSSTGWSINDLQMVGPTIQNDLFQILLRFREHQYVAGADICKMYRQVLLEPSQRFLQQIFWRADPTDPLAVYQLNTVTYGTSAASFLAIRPLLQLAEENKDSYPVASTIIQNDFYVDDLLTGSDSVEELSIHCKQISDILKQGCFELRKWVANDPQILIHVQDSSSDLNLLQLGFDERAKTLGLLWSSESDCLMYNINIAPVPTRVTKRIILSSIAQVFDPLGLLSPCTITAKIILQKLWLEKLSWDSSVPADIHSKWLSFQNELSTLNHCRIPRHVKCESAVYFELHTFSDASEAAYGACSYIRSISASGEISVNLLCAKTKVAPLSTITLPRLELCGALIAARLSNKVKCGSRSSFQNIFHWTDSTIVLGWVNTPANLLKSFVGNRISEIQTKTEATSWNHVSSGDNPADLLSRGLSPKSLIDSQLWWHGPKWLSLPQQEWPLSQSPLVNDLPELKSTIKVAQSCLAVKDPCIIPIEHFSSLIKLKRIAAYCLRFINNCSPSKLKNVGSLSACEIESGLKILIKLVQKKHFTLEISHLSKNKPLPKGNKIHSLAPFLKDGLIRVGGRLKFSPLDFNMQHPIVLPQKDHLTTLIFRDMHLRLGHTGPSHLLAAVREQFWVISGRNIARRIVRECTVCFRANPKSFPPFMGELPEPRVTPSYPFYVTGVDYAGPFILKDKLGRGCKRYKAWVCLFVCLSTKCIHIEVATDLTKDSFISCLRRFISRRGKPSKMLSDNGTNFTGAKAEIDQITCFLRENGNSFDFFCANEGIEWKFIPAYSPHFGGLWEAGVKSLKFHMKRIMRDTMLVYEDFQTVLVQIEAILNSRPLHPLSSDPNDLNPITPAHFIIGRSLVSLPDLNYMSLPENSLGRFQRIQRLQQQVWQRWTKDYLTELQHRRKWSTHSSNIQLGTLVVIKDNTPPLHWKMGRVISLHPGQDGIVRAVTLKTAVGEVRRAVVNVCPLPMANDL